MGYCDGGREGGKEWVRERGWVRALMRGLAKGFCSAKEDPLTIFHIPMLVSFCFVDENAGKPQN